MNTVKPESIALFCLTPGGVLLAKRLAAMLPVTCFTSEKLLEEGFIPFENGFANAARDAFANYSALILSARPVLRYVCWPRWLTTSFVTRRWS